MIVICNVTCYNRAVIISFKDKVSEEIFLGKRTKATRKRIPETLLKVTKRKLDQLNSITRLQDLQIPPSNRFEVLVGMRKGQYSIRINRQYRICFEWLSEGPMNVEIVDYH